MKRFILLIMLVIPSITFAQLPAMKSLGKEAKRHSDVDYFSVGSTMLDMASTFANKEKRETFRMLKHIDMIECQNPAYAPTLKAKAENIASSIGATLIGKEIEDGTVSEVYALKNGEVVSELIIIITDQKGKLAVVAMTGEIPLDKLHKIAELREK